MGCSYFYSGSGYANIPHFNLEKGPGNFELKMEGKKYNRAILFDNRYIFIDHLADPG